MGASTERSPIGRRIEGSLDGRTQAWLSAATGIRRQTINGIVVHGKMPGADKALIIARALGVGVEWLIEGVAAAAPVQLSVWQRICRFARPDLGGRA